MPDQPEERCDCCDLPVSMCGKAKEVQLRQEAAARRRALLALPGVIAARYAGTCGQCGERHPEGVPLKRKGDVWVADCCL